MIYAQNILLCLTIPFLVTLLFLRGKTRQFVVFFIFGILICLIASCISAFFNDVSEMGGKDVAVYISPIVEEIMKFFPLLFYLILFEPSDEELILMALGIGTGFATFENSCYILTSGAESLPYVLVRGMAVGVMHIISILTLVLGLVIVRFFKAQSLSAVIGALSLSVTFHALYNLLVSEQGITSYLGYVFPLFAAVLIYIPYRKLRP